MQRGFTLIEVLVAVAITAFGLAAVFTQLNQSATAASVLRERTMAHWVAMNQLAAMRLADSFPAVGNHADEVEMGGQRWRYQISVSATESDRLRRVDVSVFPAGRDQRPAATAVGFITQDAQQPRGGRSPTGWPLFGNEAGTEDPALPAGSGADSR